MGELEPKSEFVSGKLTKAKSFNGVRDLFKSVYREGGPRSLYRGIGTHPSSSSSVLSDSKEYAR